MRVCQGKMMQRAYMHLEGRGGEGMCVNEVQEPARVL
jgi:hypothetical protein